MAHSGVKPVPMKLGVCVVAGAPTAPCLQGQTPCSLSPLVPCHMAVVQHTSALFALTAQRKLINVVYDSLLVEIELITHSLLAPKLPI